MSQKLCTRFSVVHDQVSGSIPDQIIGFFDSLNSSSLTVALGFTQRPSEKSTRNSHVSKGRKADNLIAICEPIV
jgi:hypothetical protein